MNKLSIKYKSEYHRALDYATKSPHKEDFKRLLSEQMLEGLLSKGEVELKGEGWVVVTVAGMRHLMDIEGIPYD